MILSYHLRIQIHHFCCCVVHHTPAKNRNKENKILHHQTTHRKLRKKKYIHKNTLPSKITTHNVIYDHQQRSTKDLKGTKYFHRYRPSPYQSYAKAANSNSSIIMDHQFINKTTIILNQYIAIHQLYATQLAKRKKYRKFSSNNSQFKLEAKLCFLNLSLIFYRLLSTATENSFQSFHFANSNHLKQLVVMMNY